MELILWRHAEADDAFPDISRALTNKGEQQAKKMAAWLKQQLPADTKVIASPATRTQQTAEALGWDFTTLESLAPGASPHALLEAANWPKGSGTVLIIGHQPSLGMAAALAITGRIHYWSVKKGNVWWLSSRVRAHEEQSVLRAVISPDFI
ncbi:histidine phosphatase family protein [Methylovorus sp. MM2]|uniref:SixA phosphatase family protein n=1 Tax=Methylovorus sp. MM2 TaxID=1848038 RepID=UPI0007E24781|nr:histidine phosphatase family protein [Methylovorus sp. MM2]OAM51178.1 histidine phosphatase family protein [Methylovorus sp. MM2]